MDIDFSHWGPGFDAFMGAFSSRFPRIEPRRRAASYVRGLLSELERKNGWTIAEGAGDKTPDGMPRLINASQWGQDGARRPADRDHRCDRRQRERNTCR